MKTATSIFAMMALLTILVTACDNPEGSVQSEKNILTLSTPSSINTFKLVDEIYVDVQNNSNDEIVIDPTETILSIKNENEWRAVENLVDYSGIIYRLMPKDKKDANFALVMVSPIIPNDKPATVRITIKGTNQSTKQKVEAQIDVTIYP